MPWGWAPVTQPQPSSSQGLSHRRGLTFPLLGQLQQRSLPASHPKDSPSLPCVCATYVCARLCACEKWVWLSAWVPCMCLIVEWSPGAVLDGWEVAEACTGCMHGCVPVKMPCLLQRKAALGRAGGSRWFLSLFLSLTQLRQDFLANPFNFGRPQGPPAGSIPFGLLKGLWGPLKKNQATTALGERQRLLRVPWPPYCDSPHSVMTCGVGALGRF